MRKKSINAIGDLLQSSELAKLQAKVTRMQAINQCLQQVLPAELKALCKVANYDYNTIVLASTKSTITTKLNFMLPGIIKELQRMGYPNITKAKVIIERDIISTEKPYWAVDNSDLSKVENLKKIIDKD